MNAIDSNTARREIQASIKDLETKNPTMSQKLGLLQIWFQSKSGNTGFATIR